MSTCRSVLFLLATSFILNVLSSEFVPCFTWSSKKFVEKFPALETITDDMFTELIKPYVGEVPIVIFAEQTLSPEDFAQHDQSGVIFKNLAKLAKSSKVSYLPYVQNPIKAIKQLDVSVTEVPLDKIGKNFAIPETDVLIVDLKDAGDNEDRLEMLKRHDAEISLIYKDLTDKLKDVLAIYTSYHISWVASEEVARSRQVRSLLEAEVPPAASEKSPLRIDSFQSNSSNFIVYTSSYKYTYNNSESGSGTNITFATQECNTTKCILISSLQAGNKSVEMILNFYSKDGYWQMRDNVESKIDSNNITLMTTVSIVAPLKFSFHCGDQVFASNNFSVTIKDFQIQLFLDSDNKTKFNDAYDCVGFTSVPIWSGLFVTVILLLIMTIGITMMMDIRTMDRFDDAKGKTITINAE